MHIGRSRGQGCDLHSAQHAFGAWRSLVARGLWVAEVPGSNPGAPISDAAACRCKPRLQSPEPRLKQRVHREHEQADRDQPDQPRPECLMMQTR